MLQRATEAVRNKILALVPEQRRGEVQRIIEKVSKSVAPVGHDYAAAAAHIRWLEKDGPLNEDMLLTLIHRQQRDEMVVAVARLCAAANHTVGELLLGERNDAVLIPCRAADLQWSTVEAILRNRRADQKASEQILGYARKDYEKLSKATAQRTLRFMQIRDTVK